MIITWVLYTFVAFAPDGNITGLHKGLNPYDSKIECEAEAAKQLEDLKEYYADATHVYTVCYPDAGSHKLGW